MSTQASLLDSSSPESPGFYAASETTLLLLDWHSLFVEKPGQDASAALAVAAGLRSWAQKLNMTIVHALIDCSQDPFLACKDRGMVQSTAAAMVQAGGVSEADVLSAGSSGNIECETTFLRTPGHVSAPKSPGLLEHLHAKGIKSVLLTGLSTSGCVARTAFAVTDAEFVVTVVSDACADADQSVHGIMTGKVLASRNFVATAAEVQKLFEE